MAMLDHGPAHIHYELEGDPAGDPVLLIAPGGMRSANDVWQRTPWNPRLALADSYRLIGMDQRNAGASTAPVSGGDGWHTYRGDQLALLDHLDIERCHVVGMCIGGPYVVGLLRAAPERFGCAVLLQPVGIDGNRQALRNMFDEWAAELAPSHPEASADDWQSFGDNMWGGEFVLTATPDEVAQIDTPLLVLMGDDQYHPQSTSREIATQAPNATLIERWKDDDSIAATNTSIHAFLAAH